MLVNRLCRLIVDIKLNSLCNRLAETSIIYDTEVNCENLPNAAGCEYLQRLEPDIRLKIAISCRPRVSAMVLLSSSGLKVPKTHSQ